MITKSLKCFWKYRLQKAGHFVPASINVLTLYMLNFSEGKKTICLHVMSFVHTDMTQVVEILPQAREELIYST